MKKKGIFALFAAIAVAAVITGMVFFADYINAQTSTLYWGSSGNEVTKVQNRLKDWGYYNGPADGYFGADTAAAVKAFQSKNGLASDGVVGDSTWEAMGFPVSNSAPSSDYTPSRGSSARDDVTLLARLVEGEAGGSEPYLGKVAVAAVILNRVDSDQFPNTLAGVIYQPNAFESISNGIANNTPSEESIKAAQDAMNGWDPTYGCLFFWNPSKPVSAWIWSRQIQTQIGAHVFAK